MLTEDEAKVTACFKAVTFGGSQQLADGPGPLCIASSCMAWRWDMTWQSATEEGQGGDIVLRLKRREFEPKRGYCGLAGTPQP